VPLFCFPAPHSSTRRNFERNSATNVLIYGLLVSHVLCAKSRRNTFPLDSLITNLEGRTVVDARGLVCDVAGGGCEWVLGIERVPCSSDPMHLATASCNTFNQTCCSLSLHVSSSFALGPPALLRYIIQTFSVCPCNFVCLRFVLVFTLWLASSCCFASSPSSNYACFMTYNILCLRLNNFVQLPQELSVCWNLSRGRSRQVAEHDTIRGSARDLLVDRTLANP